MPMRVAAAALFCVALLIQRCLAQDDVECLREMKNSVSTSGEYLQSWDFNSSSGDGSGPNICNFIGVQCLHPLEFRVYSLSLPGAGLRGSFPSGLEKCSSLTGLDLSSNFLSGPIPPGLCKMLPYLVKLDLSQNNISGGIPAGLSDCVYLNEIRLQRNKLEGGIPGQIGLLPRLRDFNVAANRLSGPIPYTFRAFDAAGFADNEALCGAPLAGGAGHCAAGRYRGEGAAHRAAAAAARERTAVIVGAAAGGGFSLLAAAGCIFLLLGRRRRGRGGSQLDEELLETSWLRRISSPSAVVVNMFEQPIVKIRLSDLAAATAGFSREAVIGVGRTGVFYKAILRDGSALAVKKLRRSAMHAGGEKHFRSEMEALAKVRHRNLVPLLGFCIAGNERLLVYKHMPNGSLYSRLHQTDVKSNPEAALDWAARLRIAVGGARAIAWLHHSCNPRMVHRGITSSCILLDEDLEPRITDFGLARLMVSGRIRPGSSGGCSGGIEEDGFYVPPEDYSTSYSLSRAASMSSSSASSGTPKADVYAFGVVLLELVTGRKPNDGSVEAPPPPPAAAASAGSNPEEGRRSCRRSLVDWIGELFKSGHVSEAVDKALIAEACSSLMLGNGDGGSSNGSSGRRREVMQVLKIACSCVLSYPKERPSMYEVYHMLRAVGEDYYPTDPGAGAGAGAERNLNGNRFRGRGNAFGDGEEVERGGDGAAPPEEVRSRLTGLDGGVAQGESESGVQMQVLTK